MNNKNHKHKIEKNKPIKKPISQPHNLTMSSFTKIPYPQSPPISHSPKISYHFHCTYTCIYHLDNFDNISHNLSS